MFRYGLCGARILHQTHHQLQACILAHSGHFQWTETILSITTHLVYRTRLSEDIVSQPWASSRGQILLLLHHLCERLWQSRRNFASELINLCTKTSPHYAQNPHVQEQWQSNQTAPDGHRLDELRGLVQRMEMLSMQMDQLAASVQTNRQARCAVQTMPTTGASVNASSPPNSSPPLSQHPGPCPFAAHEGESRFVEIDDTDPEGGQPRAKASTNRSHAPSSSASNMSQAILEQLLREGSQARARTASVSRLTEGKLYQPG